jgi:hypothetical protein
MAWLADRPRDPRLTNIVVASAYSDKEEYYNDLSDAQNENVSE